MLLERWDAMRERKLRASAIAENSGMRSIASTSCIRTVFSVRCQNSAAPLRVRIRIRAWTPASDPGASGNVAPQSGVTTHFGVIT